MTEQQMKALATLKHGTDYLEDAVRELQDIQVMLADGYTSEDLDLILKRKRLNNTLTSGLKFLEQFQKQYGEANKC